MPNETTTIEQSRTNQEVMRAIGRIEGKMDSLIATNTNLQKIITFNENRISGVEGELKGIKGKVAIISSLIGAAITALGEWLWHHLSGH